MKYYRLYTNAISTHFIKRNAPSVLIRNANDVKLPLTAGGGNTSSIPFIQYKYIVNTTIMKLWNYKSNDLPKNGLPTRAWLRQPWRQLDKVSEGRRPGHLLNDPWIVLNLQLLSLNIYGVNAQKCVTNRIESYKESIEWQFVIAVHSRCQGVVECFAHFRWLPSGRLPDRIA